MHAYFEDHALMRSYHEVFRHGDFLEPFDGMNGGKPLQISLQGASRRLVKTVRMLRLVATARLFLVASMLRGIT